MILDRPKKSEGGGWGARHGRGRGMTSRGFLAMGEKNIGSHGDFWRFKKFNGDFSMEFFWLSWWILRIWWSHGLWMFMVEIWNSYFSSGVSCFFSFFSDPKGHRWIVSILNWWPLDDFFAVFPGKVHRVSLPVSTMRDCIPAIYGHIGDGMGWFLLLASPHYTQ